MDQESCRRTLSNNIIEEESCAEIGVGGSNVSDVVATDSGLSDNLAGDSSGSDTAVVSRMVLHPLPLAAPGFLINPPDKRNEVFMQHSKKSCRLRFLYLVWPGSCVMIT